MLRCAFTSVLTSNQIASQSLSDSNIGDTAQNAMLMLVIFTFYGVCRSRILINKTIDAATPLVFARAVEASY
eukprot:6195709-Pleurochrysis_carterae.AAC.1